MADETSGSREPFNLSQLKELIGLMEKHGLTEIDLESGFEKWRLRRGGQEQVPMQVPVHVPAPVTAALPAVPAAAPSASPAPAAASHLKEIKSPIVGTFYSSPTPDDPTFVQVGSTVSADTVVCIVEAMKVFNQITADVSGTIAEVLVKNGDPVEFGQVLFRVK